MEEPGNEARAFLEVRNWREGGREGEEGKKSSSDVLLWEELELNVAQGGVERGRAADAGTPRRLHRQYMYAHQFMIMVKVCMIVVSLTCVAAICSSLDGFSLNMSLSFSPLCVVHAYG